MRTRTRTLCRLWGCSSVAGLCLDHQDTNRRDRGTHMVKFNLPSDNRRGSGGSDASGGGSDSETFDLRPTPVGAPPMPEGIVEGAYTWRQAHLTMAQAQSGPWFGATASASSIARECGPAVETVLSEASPEGASATLATEFVLDSHLRAHLRFDPMRDTKLDLEHSPEGGRLRALLGNLDVSMSPIPGGDLVGLWGTAFGTAFIQVCSLYATDSGERYYYWHSTMLVANRPFLPGSSAAGDFARVVVLPKLMQTIAYLAETPFPSSHMMTVDRASLVGSDGGALPTALAVQRDFPQCLIRTEDGSLNFAGASAGVELGYAIPCAFNDDELNHAITIAGDAGIHHNTIIEDGYRNHSRTEELSFQLNLFAGSAIGEGEQRWISALAAGEVIEQAAELRNRAGRDPSIADQVDLALLAYSIGMPFVWAVNNEVFTRLVPDRRFDEAVALLGIAIAYDEGIESVNARSNLAVVEYQRGNIASSIPMFESLLDLDDPFVEEEPRYYLGVIALERGDHATAHGHFQWIVDNRVRHSNYIKPARERLAELMGGNSEDNTVVPLPKRPSAGTPFETRCRILGDFWFEHREEPDFEDFFAYNDIGLPLAYNTAEELAVPTEKGIGYINETFNLLLEEFEIDDDGFDSLEDLFEAAGWSDEG